MWRAAFTVRCQFGAQCVIDDHDDGWKDGMQLADELGVLDFFLRTYDIMQCRKMT